MRSSCKTEVACRLTARKDHKILCNLATNRQSSFNNEIPKNPNFVAYFTATDDSTDATYIALLSVSEECQLVKECLKLVTVEEKTAVQETFSQLVILLNKSELL